MTDRAGIDDGFEYITAEVAATAASLTVAQAMLQASGCRGDNAAAVRLAFVDHVKWIAENTEKNNV